MSTSATIKLYDMLRVKFGDDEARIFVQHFEESFLEKFEEKEDTLATKADLANVKAEMIKWMLIFWIGQIGVLTGLFLAFAKGLVH